MQRSQIWVFVKAVLFTVIVPGTVTVLIPYLLLRPHVEFDAGAFRFAGLALMALGGAVYLHCVWNFAWVGRGTPAPIDPPKEVVVVGTYRFVRNPMYVGICCLLAGEALLFQSWRLLAYAFVAWLLCHLFVVIYEEPHLRSKFGEPYEGYCRAVPRWIPRPTIRRGRR